MIIITILLNIIFLTNCAKDEKFYSFSIRNEYFESIHNTTIGTIVFDTIKIQETTLPVIINKGKYDFSTETKSGLFLQSSIDFQGDNKNKIVIIVTKNGIVKLK